MYPSAHIGEECINHDLFALTALTITKLETLELRPLLKAVNCVQMFNGSFKLMSN